MMTITTVDPEKYKSFKPPLGMRLQIALFSILRPFARRYRAECGHDTYLQETLPRFPDCGVVTLIRRKDKTVPRCHRCLNEGGIRCAWCGNPILFGDRITLYLVTKGSNPLPHAILPQGCPGTAIGGMCCADDVSGTWVAPGAILNLSGKIIRA